MVRGTWMNEKLEIMGSNEAIWSLKNEGIQEYTVALVFVCAEIERDD